MNLPEDYMTSKTFRNYLNTRYSYKKGLEHNIKRNQEKEKKLRYEYALDFITYFSNGFDFIYLDE